MQRGLVYQVILRLSGRTEVVLRVSEYLSPLQMHYIEGY